MRTRRPLVITGVAIAALLCVGSISYATTGAWVPGTGGDDEAAVTAVTSIEGAPSTSAPASTDAAGTSSAPTTASTGASSTAGSADDSTAVGGASAATSASDASSGTTGKAVTANTTSPPATAATTANSSSASASASSASAATTPPAPTPATTPATPATAPAATDPAPTSPATEPPTFASTTATTAPQGNESIRVDKCYTDATANGGGKMLIKASSSNPDAVLTAYRPDGTVIGQVENGGGSKYGGTVMPYQPYDPGHVTIRSSTGGSVTVATTAFKI